MIPTTSFVAQSILLMTPAAPGGAAPDPILQFAPLIVIAVIFYFMILRPQKKKQKAREALVNQMEKGDKIVTSHGIHGTVAQVEDSTVLVQVSDTTKIRFEKSAVHVVTPKNAAKAGE